MEWIISLWGRLLEVPRYVDLWFLQQKHHAKCASRRERLRDMGWMIWPQLTLNLMNFLSPLRIKSPELQRKRYFN